MDKRLHQENTDYSIHKLCNSSVRSMISVRVLTVQSNSSGKPVACHRSFGPALPERFSFVLIFL